MHVQGQLEHVMRHFFTDAYWWIIAGFVILSLDHVSVGERGAKICVQNFLDNQRMTPTKTIECLSPLLQRKNLQNQYLKRHYDVCKGCAL